MTETNAALVSDSGGDAPLPDALDAPRAEVLQQGR